MGQGRAREHRQTEGKKEVQGSGQLRGAKNENKSEGKAESWEEQHRNREGDTEGEREDSAEGPEDVRAEEPNSFLAKGESAELQKTSDSRKEGV